MNVLSVNNLGQANVWIQVPLDVLAYIITYKFPDKGNIKGIYLRPYDLHRQSVLTSAETYPAITKTRNEPSGPSRVFLLLSCAGLKNQHRMVQGNVPVHPNILGQGFYKRDTVDVGLIGDVVLLQIKGIHGGGIVPERNSYSGIATKHPEVHMHGPLVEFSPSG